MTLKTSLKPVFFTLFALLPLSALADTPGDVSVTFSPGQPPITGQLQAGPNGLYLDSNSGYPYPLAPGQNQINQEKKQIEDLKRQQADLIEAQKRDAHQTYLQNQKIQKNCSNLLWLAQLPPQTKKSAQDFVAECQMVQPFWRMYVKSEALLKPLEEQSENPFGFILPSGQVFNFYKQSIGYVRPNDIASASVMANTARKQPNALLPASFFKSSAQHPYQTPAKDLKAAQTDISHTEKCFEELGACILDGHADWKHTDQLFEACRVFQRKCREFPASQKALQSISSRQDCEYYRETCSFPKEVEKCHRVLKLCNADPAHSSRPSSRPYDPQKDCPVDNLIAQATPDYRDIGVPAKERFKQYQCAKLTHFQQTDNETFFHPFSGKNILYPLMRDPHEDWPSCDVDGNILFVASDSLFALGRISKTGRVDLYQDEIIRNIGKISREGKFIENPEMSHLSAGKRNAKIQKLLKHFSYIGRISPDGRVSYCGKENYLNEKYSAVNLLLLDGYVAFRKNVFMHNLKEGFHEALQTQNMVTKSNFYLSKETLTQKDMKMMQQAEEAEGIPTVAELYP